MDIHIHGNLNDITKAEKLEEIKRIKELQKDRIEAAKEITIEPEHVEEEIKNESSSSLKRKKSGKQSVH